MDWNRLFTCLEVFFTLAYLARVLGRAAPGVIAASISLFASSRPANRLKRMATPPSTPRRSSGLWILAGVVNGTVIGWLAADQGNLSWWQPGLVIAGLILERCFHPAGAWKKLHKIWLFLSSTIFGILGTILAVSFNQWNNALSLIRPVGLWIGLVAGFAMSLHLLATQVKVRQFLFTGFLIVLAIFCLDVLFTPTELQRLGGLTSMISANSESETMAATALPSAAQFEVKLEPGQTIRLILDPPGSTAAPLILDILSADGQPQLIELGKPTPTPVEASPVVKTTP